MTFKLQHPADLLSKLFMLEYMRELTPELLYTKATDDEKTYLFYKFIDAEGNTQIDFSWEALLFDAHIEQLENLMNRFVVEIEKLEAVKQQQLIEKRGEMMAEAQSAPVDINIYDMAQTEINKSKDASKLWKPQ